MTTPLVQPEWAAILQAAADPSQPLSHRPKSTDLTKALIQAEKASKQQHQIYPFHTLWGDWQLCFSAPKKAHQKGSQFLGKGLYVPSFTPAQISFYPPAESAAQALIGSIANQIQAGPLLIRFTGPARYVGKKNLLAFDFTQLQISVFGRNLYNGNIRGGSRQQQQFVEQPVSKLPFFAFFHVTDRYIAARGKGGGLAIWVKVD